uniref:Protein TSSC4 n=1 Tax=Heterorhabditis bacteriophora TaxID=37862 RepID=A0A1I7WW08_HETBA
MEPKQLLSPAGSSFQIFGLSRTSYNSLDSLKVALVNSWDKISGDELRTIVVFREPNRSKDWRWKKVDSYKADQMVQYSDWSEQENSRAPSRGSYKKHAKIKHEYIYCSVSFNDSLADSAERLEAVSTRVDRMLQELNAYGDFTEIKPLEYRPFPTAYGSIKSIHRAMSSACHTEYDNAESEAALSDTESTNANGRLSRYREKRRRKWRPCDGTDADAESQCSSTAGSIDLDPLRWKSVHSIGYENEYEMQSDNEGLAIEEMKALSRDIRKNFGDFQLATFDDIDQD